MDERLPRRISRHDRPETDFETIEARDFYRPLAARVGSQEIALGQVRYACASARLASALPVDKDRVRLAFARGTDNRVLIQPVPTPGTAEGQIERG